MKPYGCMSLCLLTSVLSVQNALGIFVAGGLGGALYLQKQAQEKLEAEKQAHLAAQQLQIEGLNSQVVREPPYTAANLIQPPVAWQSPSL